MATVTPDRQYLAGLSTMCWSSPSSRFSTLPVWLPTFSRIRSPTGRWVMGGNTNTLKIPSATYLDRLPEDPREPPLREPPLEPLLPPLDFEDPPPPELLRGLTLPLLLPPLLRFGLESRRGELCFRTSLEPLVLPDELRRVVARGLTASRPREDRWELVPDWLRTWLWSEELWPVPRL